MFSNHSSTRHRQQKDDVDDNKKDAVDGQDEVKFLRNLVSEIQSEKKELYKLLDQQQRLALQDKQLLEEYKAEIKDLKALTMAPHDDGEKEVAAQKQPEPETNTAEAKSKHKKWWRFGK
ncbi:hypothetical protein ff3pr_02299 [Weissella cibaria]|nr:hypothetical protein ff3pr_02299 [Weissella cibaria]